MKVYLLRLPVLSEGFCAATTNKEVATVFAEEIEDNGDISSVVSLELEDFSYFSKDAQKRWGMEHANG